MTPSTSCLLPVLVCTATSNELVRDLGFLLKLTFALFRGTSVAVAYFENHISSLACFKPALIRSLESEGFMVKETCA